MPEHYFFGPFFKDTNVAVPYSENVTGRLLKRTCLVVSSTASKRVDVDQTPWPRSNAPGIYFKIISFNRAYQATVW